MAAVPSKLNPAFEKVKNLFAKQHYVCFDDLINIAGEEALSISDVDKLSDLALSSGIFVLEEAPSASRYTPEDNSEKNTGSEFYDMSQTDYDAVFDRVLQLAPQMSGFINKVRAIKPPQPRETASIKEQLFNGNRYARKRMIEMHLRLAVKIALQRAERYDLDIEDMIGDACMGLMTAVNHYNPDSDEHFSSYASYYILQAISREQTIQNPLFYCPIHVKEICYAVLDELKKSGLSVNDIDYTNDHYDEIINRVLRKKDRSIELSTVKRVLSDLYSLEDLEEKLEAADFSDPDIISCYRYAVTMPDPADGIVKKFDNERFISNYLSVLKERELFVITRRLGLNGDPPKTLEEISQEMNITRERVRQIECKGLQKIKNRLLLERRHPHLPPKKSRRP